MFTLVRLFPAFINVTILAHMSEIVQLGLTGLAGFSVPIEAVVDVDVPSMSLDVLSRGSWGGCALADSGGGEGSVGD